MNKTEQIQNTAFAIVFTALAFVALYGAIFKGASHHYATSLVCGAMAAIFWEETAKCKSKK